MSNQWDDLPNAKYIDAILASAEDPYSWSAKEYPDNFTVIDSVWTESIQIADNLGRLTARTSALVLIDGSRWPARAAVGALIAWDDCAYMLSAELSEVQLLSCLGDPRAVMLLPARKILDQYQIVIDV